MTHSHWVCLVPACLKFAKLDAVPRNGISQGSQCMVPTLPAGVDMFKISLVHKAPGAAHAHQDVSGSSPHGQHLVATGGDHHSSQPYIVFVGAPWVLRAALEVTSYQPRLSWLPIGAPGCLHQLLAYTFAVSAGMALLNMMPAHHLDGEAALNTVLEVLAGSSGVGVGGGLPEAYRAARTWILRLGTGGILSVVLVQICKILIL